MFKKIVSISLIYVLILLTSSSSFGQTTNQPTANPNIRSENRLKETFTAETQRLRNEVVSPNFDSEKFEKNLLKQTTAKNKFSNTKKILIFGGIAAAIVITVVILANREDDQIVYVDPNLRN